MKLIFCYSNLGNNPKNHAVTFAGGRYKSASVIYELLLLELHVTAMRPRFMPTDLLNSRLITKINDCQHTPTYRLLQTHIQTGNTRYHPRLRKQQQYKIVTPG